MPHITIPGLDSYLKWYGHVKWCKENLGVPGPRPMWWGGADC